MHLKEMKGHATKLYFPNAILHVSLALMCIHCKTNHYRYDMTIPYSRVLLEKLKFTHLIEKFPAFYGIQTFITVFRRAHFEPYESNLHLQTLLL